MGGMSSSNSVVSVGEPVGLSSLASGDKGVAKVFVGGRCAAMLCVPSLLWPALARASSWKAVRRPRSITAPMATAYALSEIIGGNEARKSKLFRGIALFVVLAGAAISLSGIRPVSLILIAQYANGLLLPLVAAFLLYVMNRKDLLGAHANGLAPNVAGSMVVLITFGLGLRSILRAAGVM